MPKNAAKSEIYSFIGGLVTEASELAFPANAASEIENFEINRDGSISRRLGMDLEPLFQLFNPPSEVNPLTSPKPVTFKWSNVAGISNFSVLAIQFDDSIMFFDIDVANLSSQGYLGSLELDGFPKDVRYGLSSVDGKLVVVAGIEKIAIVSYSGGTFTATYGTLKTRDLWGVECFGTHGEKFEKDDLYRSGGSPEVVYNLRNQSWGSPRTRASDGVSFDPIRMYNLALDVFPSNSEQVWSGLQYKPDSSGNPTERFYPSMCQDLYGTSSKAAKGYFIIDVINRGASRLKAVQDNYDRNPGKLFNYSNITQVDYTNGGATCLVEYAGRMFFAGFTGETVGGDARSPNLSNHVFFSQLVKSTGDILKCYQQGDPTSRDEADIVDTDGGFIRISGAEKILAMVPTGSRLLVICSNGVWSITGGSDYGFTATNYKVDQVSSFGCISATSVVEEKGRVFYWGEDGIFVVTKNELGDSISENVTRGVIDKFYQELPIQARTSSIGVYDNIAGKIRWIYDIAEGETYELILDSNLKCFYPFKLFYPNDLCRVIGVFTTTPFNKYSEIDDVLVNIEQVQSNTDYVAIDGQSSESSLTAVKYLIRFNNQYSFAYYRNNRFLDFEIVNGNGNDAVAKCLTGAITAGDSSIRKQVQFLTLHFKQTAFRNVLNGPLINESGCLSQTRWDWANKLDSSKFGALKQVVRNSKPQDITNFDVITSRNMLRGQGRAFALYFQTEPRKDCKIIGWNLAIDGNAKI